MLQFVTTSRRGEVRREGYRGALLERGRAVDDSRGLPLRLVQVAPLLLPRRFGACGTWCLVAGAQVFVGRSDRVRRSPGALALSQPPGADRPGGLVVLEGFLPTRQKLRVR